MSIKKQAINDATDLFEMNAGFWTGFDAAKQKCFDNPKYDEAFTKAYNNLAKKFAAGREAEYFEAAAKVTRRNKKPMIFGLSLIAAGILHGTGYDKLLLEKGKQRFRRTQLVVTDFVNKGETYDKVVDTAADKIQTALSANEKPAREIKHPSGDQQFPLGS